MRRRVLVAKAGLDAHERGVHVVSLGLRDAGMEVVVAGLRSTPTQLAATAVQEDVDVVGISSLAGGHRSFAQRLDAALRDVGYDGIVVFGGVIPEEDDIFLREHGVSAVFRPGTLVTEIADTIDGLLART